MSRVERVLADFAGWTVLDPAGSTVELAHGTEIAVLLDGQWIPCTVETAQAVRVIRRAMVISSGRTEKKTVLGFRMGDRVRIDGRVFELARDISRTGSGGVELREVVP